MAQGCRGIGGVYEVAETDRNMLISVTQVEKKNYFIIFYEVIIFLLNLCSHSFSHFFSCILIILFGCRHEWTRD